MVRAHNPRTPKKKAGRSGVQDHRPVLKELEATLGITIVSISKQTKYKASRQNNLGSSRESGENSGLQPAGYIKRPALCCAVPQVAPFRASCACANRTLLPRPYGPNSRRAVHRLPLALASPGDGGARGPGGCRLPRPALLREKPSSPRGEGVGPALAGNGNGSRVKKRLAFWVMVCLLPATVERVESYR